MKLLNDLIDMNSSKNSKILVGLLFAIVTIILIFLKVWFIYKGFPEIPIDIIWTSGSLSAIFFGLGIKTPNVSALFKNEKEDAG